MDKFEKNNFNILRLIAAVAVIFSHSYALLNLPDPLAKFSNHIIDFGYGAVALFFFVSGYLVTKSNIDNDNIVRYFIARILRIFPGLVVAMLFAVFVIGMTATVLPKMEYLHNWQLYNYLIENITLHRLQVALPGVFLTNPYPVAVNGSIWTLPVEFLMYIIVGVFGFLKIFKRKYLANSCIVLAWLLFIAWYFLSGKGQNSHILQSVSMLFLSFAIGSLFYLNKDLIKFNVFIIFLLMIASYLLKNSIFFKPIFYISYAYITFYVAQYRHVFGKFITKHGDFSYGIYIYAFPVQQYCIYYFDLKQPWEVFVVSLPITITLAVFSWYYVEKPSLKLKSHILSAIQLNKFRNLKKMSV